MPTTLPALPRRNAPWTPFQRRTWLANERRHRLLPAPVLRAAYPDLLRWDWDLPNPYKWNVWMSMDGGNSYFLVDDYWVYGDARQFAPDGGGELYYIVGIDETGREITKHSNLVRPDDAPVPAITLLSDGHGHLTWTVNFTSQYDQINIYMSGDGVTWPADAFDGWDLASGSRDCSGTAGYFRICVCDFDGHDVLPYSNSVHSDGL